MNVVRDDGYTKNRLTGHSGNDTDRWAARGSLSFTPSSTFDALVQLRYGKTSGGSIWAYNRSLFPFPATIRPPPARTAFARRASTPRASAATSRGYANTSSDLYRGDYHFEGKDEVETRGASATLTWDLGDLQLVSVSGYDHADRDDREDTDAGPNDVITATYRAKQSVFSEELRLQSTERGGQGVLGRRPLLRARRSRHQFVPRRAARVPAVVRHAGQPERLRAGVQRRRLRLSVHAENRELGGFRPARLRLHRSTDRHGRACATRATARTSTTHRPRSSTRSRSSRWTRARTSAPSPASSGCSTASATTRTCTAATAAATRAADSSAARRSSRRISRRTTTRRSMRSRSARSCSRLSGACAAASPRSTTTTRICRSTR